MNAELVELLVRPLKTATFFSSPFKLEYTYMN